MPSRRASWLTSVHVSARVGGLAACLALAALAAAGCTHGSAGTVPAQAATAAAAVIPVGPVPGVRLAAQRDPLGACESRIERAPAGALPAMAIVGASVTGGTGPNNPRLSWAVVLAEKLRRNAVIAGVPGIGYVRVGDRGLGPVARLLAGERLRALRPSLVIIQAGHDDAGVLPGVERQRVAQAIALIRARAPRARIALLTVFTVAGRPVPAALYRTDRAIVTAGRTADPKVIIMDPLTGRWKYARARDGLHPTAAGDAWIARKVAAVLRAHGVLSAARTAASPLICDYVP